MHDASICHQITAVNGGTSREGPLKGSGSPLLTPCFQTGSVPRSLQIN